MTAAHVNDFDRIAMVDVQPHYFGGEIDRVDLVIDHHPEQSGYTAVYKDIRVDYGSTSTILTEHLRAVDANISERTATAMLYAIKSDTLFFNRQANRVDIEAFSYLYPLADATLIRKMEGAEITMDRLDYVLKARQNGRMTEQVFCAFLGTTPREDFIPYVADFYLQLEDVQWTIISGIVNDTLVMSVRNLGYSRNAGEFVRKYFNEIGSAGGHRAMAKAVVPLRNFKEKFGNLQADEYRASSSRWRSSSSTSTRRQNESWSKRNDEGHARLFQLSVVRVEQCDASRIEARPASTVGPKIINSALAPSLNAGHAGSPAPSGRRLCEVHPVTRHRLGEGPSAAQGVAFMLLRVVPRLGPVAEKQIRLAFARAPRPTIGRAMPPVAERRQL